jgi:hypothetical protein
VPEGNVIEMIDDERRFREAASWRVATEIARRHPHLITIMETFPCSGQYDCLSLIFKNQTNICDMNRLGRLHVHERCDGQPPPESYDIWPDMVTTNNPKQVVDHVTKMLGLSIPSRLPASTPRIIVYRYIATFLTRAVSGTARWVCRNGFCDSASMCAGIRDTYFREFPDANTRRRETAAEDISGISASRFWFLCRNDDPILCLETTGNLWTASGRWFDLGALYSQDRRISALLQQTASNLLAL